MARVAPVSYSDLPPETRDIVRRFGTEYGPFGNQAQILAHVPPAAHHLAAMLMELKARGGLKRRYVELAVTAVSKINACDYCVAHHGPYLQVEGISADGVDRVLDYPDHPEFDNVDKLVVEYAIEVTDNAGRIRDALFDRLRAVFSESEIVELTLRIALCGFFNRFNDALTIELETELAGAPSVDCRIKSGNDDKYMNSKKNRHSRT